MTSFWIITVSLLVVYTILTALVSLNYYKRQNSEKLWKLLGLRIGFWQGAVLVSIGLTMLTLFLLKWTNLLTF